MVLRHVRQAMHLFSQSRLEIDVSNASGMGTSVVLNLSSDRGYFFLMSTIAFNLFCILDSPIAY